MSLFNSFPSEPFGVNKKYGVDYRGWKPLPPVSNALWERLTRPPRLSGSRWRAGSRDLVMPRRQQSVIRSGKVGQPTVAAGSDLPDKVGTVADPTAWVGRQDLR